MKELMDLGLFTKKDKVLVSSRIVAENFEKEHKEIIYTIEGRVSKGKIRNKGLYKELMEIGGELHLSNYMVKSKYTDSQNRVQTEYLLTRDGFSLVTMSLKGKKALIWKLKYIDAFNKMEAFIREKLSSEWLQTRKNGKLIRRNETDNLSELVLYAISQGSKTYEKNPKLIYKHYSTLANNAVGIKTGQREYVTRKVLDTIAFIEDMILNTVKEEMDKDIDYHQIYKTCKKRADQIVKYAYLPRQRLIA